MGSHALIQSSPHCSVRTRRGVVNEDVATEKGKSIRKLWPRFRQERSSDLSRRGMSLHPQRAQTLLSADIHSTSTVSKEQNEKMSRDYFRSRLIHPNLLNSKRKFCIWPHVPMYMSSLSATMRTTLRNNCDGFHLKQFNVLS